MKKNYPYYLKEYHIRHPLGIGIKIETGEKVIPAFGVCQAIDMNENKRKRILQDFYRDFSLQQNLSFFLGLASTINHQKNRKKMSSKMLKTRKTNSDHDFY